MDKPASRHIPLIFFGKPLLDSWRGERINTFGNHHDIPALIVEALRLGPSLQESEGFQWSRNLFHVNESEAVYLNASGQKSSFGFAYYTNENGLGWATTRGKGFYEFGSRKWRIFEGQLDSLDRANAQAYLQTLYNDFLAK